MNIFQGIIIIVICLIILKALINAYKEENRGKIFENPPSPESKFTQFGIISEEYGKSNKKYYCKR